MKPPIHFFALFLSSLLLFPEQAFSDEIEKVAEQMEVVVLRAERIPALLNTPKEKLSIYAWRGQTLQPIPWQIDQDNGAGLIYLDWENGQKMNMPENISSQDKLLWMASDMGDRAAASLWASQNKPVKWLELEMKRKAGDSRWLYLMISQEISVPSSLDYVSYQPEKDQVTSNYYLLSFMDPIRADRFTWKNPDGSEGSNLLNSISIRFRARILGIIPIQVSEHDFTNTLMGFKDGPIRVIKRVKSVPHLPFGFRGQPQIVDYYFSRHVFENEVRIKIPDQGKILLYHASFTMSLRMAPRQEPILLHLPRQREFSITSRLSPGNHLLQEDPPSWVHFSSESIPLDFITYVRFPTSEREVFFPQELIYTHAGSSKEQLGTLSCEIKQELKRGEHAFSVYLFTIPNAVTKLPASLAAESIDRMLDDPFQLRSVTIH